MNWCAAKGRPTRKIGTNALTDGQNGINYNFGDLKAVTLSGTVYQDTNGNGKLDAGDTGMAGVNYNFGDFRPV